MHFIPLLSLQWWSQPLKILPIFMKGHLLSDTITDPLLSSSMERQVRSLSVWVHVYIIVIIFVPLLQISSRNQDFMFESPPDVISPNDCFQSPGFKGVSPDGPRQLGNWVGAPVSSLHTPTALQTECPLFICSTYWGKCLQAAYNRSLSSLTHCISSAVWEERGLWMVCL